ncbi:peptide-methionine (S)-S-oxide reductase MsrA [Campylobacter jejuni]|uniref:peptide-methionine (S)-S-oxide reductase MsrA n=1 Tax=Campylobacter jejuni TaxID=197 RepID=UPI00069AFBA8|nr:peptide-methionine (S)-S-oxide reductase MsrA [Campylobacter jejuni]EAI3991965.1 peptide-methionine (S)-S-oxide reductase MsrA [Campylobacter jejuni]EAI7918478.1 peptide-methionine (S)-S-oxide reductase MsrA [Campylobacter jejuni]ECK7421445.1 peptide-methionine (S)-S-oxide reductase MsrA [Campylobacter jejuni]ECK7539252.1 peptide-methionine (S)-S-oxide reductase MsrA [Campylobacter jejuni]ECK7556705.1 peptide-methionine (S)-S-oxide reductase MsrA [Campylobacter jejuni]
MKNIVLGGGCFWCVEAVFERLKGVINTEVGYSGGNPNPSYESVCNGDGNIEVVKINYDEKQISLLEILTLFFKIHDPTSIDKQGGDIGIQYRSIIFYENEEDKILAQNFIEEQQKIFSKKIVTKISRLQTYYKAENYHQNYFINNPDQGYCQAVIAPKLQKIQSD